VRVEVQDDGIGIDPDDAESLFDVFERGTASDDEGTGIGLALANRIVERHDGHIGVDSQPGEGSTFWFELPHDPSV